MTVPDHTDAITLQRKMLTVCGLWPTVKSPTIWYRLRKYATWIMSLSLCFTMWMEAVHDWNDFAKLSEILYVLITVTVYILKLMGFTYYTKEFCDMIESLGDPIFQTYPENMGVYVEKAIQISTFITRIYGGMCGVVIAQYALMPFLDDTPLPLPFSYNIGSFAPLMYVFQVTGCGIAAWANGSMDTLTAGLMSIAAAHLDILGRKLNCIKSENKTIATLGINLEEDRKTKETLVNCVNHHHAIIKFVDNIETVFTFGILVQFLASIIAMCNTLFHIVLVSEISFLTSMLIIYLLAMLTELYMYCWFGNEIMYKSLNIGDACYLSEWYDCSESAKNELLIIMQRTRKPLKITTLGLSTLSLATFTSILQWSYSYFAMLMKMYLKKTGNVK